MRKLSAALILPLLLWLAVGALARTFVEDGFRDISVLLIKDGADSRILVRGATTTGTTELQREVVDVFAGLSGAQKIQLGACFDVAVAKA